MKQVLLAESSVSVATRKEQIFLLTKLAVVKSFTSNNPQTTLLQKLIDYIAKSHCKNSSLLFINIVSMVAQRALPVNYCQLIAGQLKADNHSANCCNTTAASTLDVEQMSTVVGFAAALHLLSSALTISELSSSVLGPLQQKSYQLQLMTPATLTDEQLKELMDIYPISMIHHWLSHRVEKDSHSSSPIQSKSTTDCYNFGSDFTGTINSLLWFCTVARDVAVEMMINGGASETLLAVFTNLFKLFYDLLKVQGLSQCKCFHHFIDQCSRLFTTIDASVMHREMTDRLFSLMELLFKSEIINDASPISHAQALSHVSSLLNALTILPQERTFSLLSTVSTLWKGFGFLDTRAKGNLASYRRAFVSLADQYYSLTHDAQHFSEKVRKRVDKPCPFLNVMKVEAHESPLYICDACHIRSLCGTKCMCGNVILCDKCKTSLCDGTMAQAIPPVDFLVVGGKLVDFVGKVLFELAKEKERATATEESGVALFGRCYSLTLLEAFEVFSALAPSLLLEEGPLRRRFIDMLFYFLLNRLCQPRAVAGIISNLHCTSLPACEETALVAEVRSLSEKPKRDVSAPQRALSSFVDLFVESSLCNGETISAKLLDSLSSIEEELCITGGNSFSCFVDEARTKLMAHLEPSAWCRTAKRQKLSPMAEQTPEGQLLSLAPCTIRLGKCDAQETALASTANNCAWRDGAMPFSPSETSHLEAADEAQPAGQTCPVCMDLRCDYKLGCGHVFCHECLALFETVTTETEGKSISCPLCKATSREIYSIRFLENLLQEQK